MFKRILRGALYGLIFGLVFGMLVEHPAGVPVLTMALVGLIVHYTQ